MHLGHASNQQHCKQSIFDLQQNKSSSKIIKQAKLQLGRILLIKPQSLIARGM